MSKIENALIGFRDNADYSETPSFPTCIHIEPTRRCNAHCSFCYNRLSRNQRGKTVTDLPLDFGIHALCEAYANGAREVGLHFRGEPLLYPFLAELVANARSIGYSYIYLFTNGIVATFDCVKNLFENGLDSIAFSINAGDAETYARIHGVDAFDSVVSNLIDCTRIRDEFISGAGRPPMKIMVSSVATPESQTSVNRLHEIVAPLHLDDERVVTKDSTLNVHRNGVCWRPFSCFIVTCDGYLTVCCGDPDMDIAYGKPSQTPLMEVWHGTIAKELRRRMLNDDLRGTLCGRCIYGFEDAVKPLFTTCAH